MGVSKTIRLQMTDEQGSYTWTSPRTGERFSVRRVYGNHCHSWVARGNCGTVVTNDRLDMVRALLAAL